MLYGLAAPAAFVAVPLAVLLACNGLKTRPARLLAALAGLVGGWWLLGAGELPDQTVRAATVLAAAAFALLSWSTAWTVTHRALAAVAVAAGGTAVGFVALGWSWDRLQWWIAFRTGPALRLVLTRLALSPAGEGTGSTGLPRGSGAFEALLDQLVRTSAQLFPAAIGLQLLVGLVLATAAARLVAPALGTPLGRFATFSFSDHLGWVLVLALLALFLPAPGAIRPLAANLAVITGVLFTVRGLAVLIFGIQAIGGGPLLYAGAAAALFFLFPGFLLLGVLDGGFNLRRRRAPSSGD